MLKISSIFSLSALSIAAGLSFPVVAQDKIPFDAMPYTAEHRLLVEEIAKGFEPEIHVEKVISSPNGWMNWETVENYAYGKDRGSLPMITDLDALHPYFKEKIQKFIAACKRKGIEVAIVESYRTVAKQNEYKAMGKKYTRAVGGHSKHQYGLAIDVVPLVKSIPQWDNTQLWKRIGAIGEQLGLRWGGRWRTLYDPGHFEWSGGVSSTSLAKGVTPFVAKSIATKYPCMEEDLLQLTEYWSAWEAEQATLTRKSSPTSGQENAHQQHRISSEME